MNATPVNRDEMRMLVLNVGYKRTSEETGVKEGTLRQWARRGQWFPKVQPVRSSVVTSVVKSPADVLSDELANNERETRISLSRYTKKAAKDAEGATLWDAKLVKAVADTAGATFDWSSRKGSETSQVAVNIAILGA